MKTQVKGDLAVAYAIAKLTELGYGVLTPLTESAQYDLVVEIEGEFKRVQVKYSTRQDVDLRRIHSNSTGYVVKKYNNGYDLLFVMKPNKKCYLINRNLDGRSYVRPKESELI